MIRAPGNCFNSLFSQTPDFSSHLRSLLKDDLRLRLKKLNLEKNHLFFLLCLDNINSKTSAQDLSNNINPGLSLGKT